jgi:hypothetical protein
MRETLEAVAVAVAITTSLGVSGNAQESWGTVFKNERLKAITLPDRTIVASSRYATVEGIWVPESKEPSKALVFPQQVRIDCHAYGSDERRCTEITVMLAPARGVVAIGDIDTAEYNVDTWDGHGLVASYGGDTSSKCQRHVLTMDFQSGAVSLADIPTHKEGCEAFKETNPYRLVRGHYYVDTSPNNDWDKPVEQPGKK